MSEDETYDRYAEECRKMAATTKNPEHKKQFEEMAAAWASLARERSRQRAKTRKQASQKTSS